MGKKDLTSLQRKQVISDLLEGAEITAEGACLARGAVTRVAKKFAVSRPCISKIWKRAVDNWNDPEVQAYVSSPLKKGHCGRKRKNQDAEALGQAVMAIPRNKRRTIRDLARELGIPKSTVHRIIQRGDVIFPHTNAIKPTLTPGNKVDRVMYCIENMEKDGDGEWRFRGQFDRVHIDEKWFFITEQTQRLYLALGEDEPERTCSHKSHIIKVMFLAAVAHPRFDEHGNCTFDGKVGLWPFVERVRAQRSSHNRPRGTLETKSVNVTKDVYRQYVLDKVLPAIKAKWPVQRLTYPIGLQHNNAKSHFQEDDEEWLEAATADN